ncbi:MAG: hypothetical protein LC808_42230 [Actinobacteria bacterium]|nr:hypothetical protein [Actinomycetota bacterium]
MRVRAWAETVVAVLAAVVGILTQAHPTWFEALFEASPDEGSGIFERIVAVVLIAGSVALSLAARRNVHRSRVVGADPS